MEEGGVGEGGCWICPVGRLGLGAQLGRSLSSAVGSPLGTWWGTRPTHCVPWCCEDSASLPQILPEPQL